MVGYLMGQCLRIETFARERGGRDIDAVARVACATRAAAIAATERERATIHDSNNNNSIRPHTLLPALVHTAIHIIVGDDAAGSPGGKKQGSKANAVGPAILST